MVPLRPFARARGFTLIELLTVVAIIAILAAILLPVTQTVQNTARKTQASSDVRGLVSAVNSFCADYGHYPLNSDQIGGASEQGGSNDTVYGDPSGKYSSGDLCNILRAIPDDRRNQNNDLNPKAVKYFDGKDVKNPKEPRGGFLPASAKEATTPYGTIKSGAFLDPWGGEYVIWIDANYDNDLEKSMGWFYYTNTPKLTKTVVGASLGKDNKWGTEGNGNPKESDDVFTW